MVKLSVIWWENTPPYPHQQVLWTEKTISGRRKQSVVFVYTPEREVWVPVLNFGTTYCLERVLSLHKTWFSGLMVRIFVFHRMAHVFGMEMSLFLRTTSNQVRNSAKPILLLFTSDNMKLLQLDSTTFSHPNSFIAI